MTSAQSLLYAAASDVTIGRVRALVRHAGAESPTIEYKGQMCDTIARGVAALGNTYGGLLLVGVTDDRIVRGEDDRVGRRSLRRQDRAALGPGDHPGTAWPGLGPVRAGRAGPPPQAPAGRRVAYIRHQNTTHPADWQRLRDLFAESAAARQDDLWDLHAPDLPRGSDGTPDGTEDFVVRSGLNVTVTPDAQWRPPEWWDNPDDLLRAMQVQSAELQGRGRDGEPV